jgi:D-glucosaminate-6-phosphate ammonia-lyase
MLKRFDSWSSERLRGLSRREVFRVAGLLGIGSLLRSPRVEASATAPALPAAPGAVEIGPKIYDSLGVRPFINCRGTITVIGGSMEQPEVRAAKTLANQQYVQMDELMAAAGKRLAELTGAEWGMVSAGCAAAISHATAACIAGGNPDLHIRIPDLRGFAKDEVIIPTESRNSYDAAITAVGAKLIEVDSMDALKLAIGPKTAMIYVEGGTGTDSGPMSVEAISAVAKQHNVPVLVDAAPEILTVRPNVHLQRGATLVAYSGGKVIRGPQSAGLLLGRKDLVQAAWVHSAPHHGYARSMKIGREEIVGMVVAVENYVKRDHDAEWKEWVGRCDHIANRLTKIPGVVANVRREPGGRGNRSPRVSIAWDSKRLNITGTEVTEILNTTEPRIVLGGGGGGRGQPQEAGTDTSISMSAFMMAAGDEKIVANRLFEILSAKRAPKATPAVKPPAGDLTGTWKVDIQFAASKSTHTINIAQHGNRLQGTHQAEFRARELAGSIDGDQVEFATRLASSEGVAVGFRFSGKLSGDSMSGALDMGEYLDATWTARRQAFGGARPTQGTGG